MKARNLYWGQNNFICQRISKLFNFFGKMRRSSRSIVYSLVEMPIMVWYLLCKNDLNNLHVGQQKTLRMILWRFFELWTADFYDFMTNWNVNTIFSSRKYQPLETYLRCAFWMFYHLQQTHNVIALLKIMCHVKSFRSKLKLTICSLPRFLNIQLTELECNKNCDKVLSLKNSLKRTNATKRPCLNTVLASIWG